MEINEKYTIYTAILQSDNRDIQKTGDLITKAGLHYTLDWIRQGWRPT